MEMRPWKFDAGSRFGTANLLGGFMNVLRAGLPESEQKKSKEAELQWGDGAEKRKWVLRQLIW
jgi:hypothetical protein